MHHPNFKLMDKLSQKLRKMKVITVEKQKWKGFRHREEDPLICHPSGAPSLPRDKYQNRDQKTNNRIRIPFSINTPTERMKIDKINPKLNRLKELNFQAVGFRHSDTIIPLAAFLQLEALVSQLSRPNITSHLQNMKQIDSTNSHPRKRNIFQYIKHHSTKATQV